MQDLVAYHQALADPTRWRIASLVLDEPLCVCELAEVLGVPQSTLSSHLQVMKRAGLFHGVRHGKWIYYQVASAMQPLVRAAAAHFADGLSGDRSLRADRARAAKRIAGRDGSCCPAPVLSQPAALSSAL